MTKNYLQQRGKMKTWTYRRRIPVHVQPIFGKTMLTLSMKTQDKGIATMRANEISRQFDRNIRLAELGKPIERWQIELRHTTLTRTEMAHELLGKIGGVVLGHHNINEYEGYYDEAIAKLEGLGLHDVPYDEANNANYTEISTQVRDAIDLVRGNKIDENPTLTTALNLYLKYKGKEDDLIFRKNPTYAVNSFINQFGDMPLRQIRRINALEYRDNLIAGGSAPGTAKRKLNAIRAIVSTTNDILEMDMSNPFNRISVEVPDSIHIPLESESWESVLKMPSTSDHVHLVALMLVNTGCRISEVVGLLVDDVYLEEEIPFIQIQAHAHRTLKTKTSSRTIPLTGITLAAATILKSEAKKAKSRFLIRHYNLTGHTNGNSASAAIKKRFNIASHSFRHELISRLRDVECPTDIQSFIAGHALSSSSKHYGDKHQLPAKHRWLLKVAMDFLND